MQNRLSVIVTTHNSERTLAWCLSSLRVQTIKPYEVLVIDNNSSDKTVHIAQQFTTKIFQAGPERSAQRNYGAYHARGNYLLFLDSDMELAPMGVGEIMQTFRDNPSVVGVYIPEKVRGTHWWSQMRTFERSFYNETSIDAVRAVRKVVFEIIGGFDESLTGPEDWDFDKRVRAQGATKSIQSSLFHHEEEVTFKSYFTKKMYYAQDFETYKHKWGSEDIDIKNQFGLWYRYVGVFTEKGKWKKLLSHPILSIQMFSVRVLLGAFYLVNTFQRSKK